MGDLRIGQFVQAWSTQAFNRFGQQPKRVTQGPPIAVGGGRRMVGLLLFFVEGGGGRGGAGTGTGRGKVGLLPTLMGAGPGLAPQQLDMQEIPY